MKFQIFYPCLVLLFAGCDKGTDNPIACFETPLEMGTTIEVGEEFLCFNCSVNATSYLFDFGDGTSNSTGLHTYQAAGTYNIILTAINDEGRDTQSKSVFIPDNQWEVYGEGINGPVNAMIVFQDELFVGGQFTSAGGVSVNNIAKWDGLKFESVGEGITGIIYAMVIFNDELYAAGNFNSFYNIRKWNGSSWSKTFVTSNYPTILSLATFNNKLYLGGKVLEEWDGINQPPLVTDPFENRKIYSLCVFDSKLYIGGVLKASSGFGSPNLEALNANGLTNSFTFDDLGVTALFVFANKLFIAGPYNEIFEMINSEFKAVANYGNLGVVHTLSKFKSDLIAGGYFSSIEGGRKSNNIAKWDGNTWIKMGAGVNGAVYTTAEYKNKLYVGGLFTSAGGLSTNNIATWH